jgi:hypothetical protein
MTHEGLLVLLLLSSVAGCREVFKQQTHAVALASQRCPDHRVVITRVHGLRLGVLCAAEFDQK